MDFYKFSVAVGGNHPMPVKGSFVHYKDVTNGATASTIKVQTNSGDTLILDPNDCVNLPHTFTRIEVTNYDGSETIAGLLVIGEGRFTTNSVTGSMTITNTPHVIVDSGSLNVAVPTRQAHPFYRDYGVSYAATSALAANTPEQVFAPGSNTNGAIVYSASMLSLTASGTVCAFLAKASAPTGVTDGDMICGVDNINELATATTYGVGGKTDTPIYIPAGKGLYFISAGLQVAGVRSALYRLL